jgi:hypothetical protein
LETELLESIANISIPQDKLDGKYLEIMLSLLKRQATTAYEFYKSKSDLYNQAKQVWVDFNYLKKSHLIEDLRGKSKLSSQKRKNEKIPYSLSLNGIFYVIINNPNPFNDQIAISLIQNYG